MFSPLGSTAAAETKKLVFSQIMGSLVQKSASDLITLLYSRLGIETSFTIIPAKRALEMSSKGKTDGEIFRIWAVGDRFNTLIRVPTPIMTLSGYAYSNKEGLTVNSVADLGEASRIGIVRGIVWAEKLIEGRHGVVRVNSSKELVLRLANGSVDVVLANNTTLETEQKKQNIKAKFYKGNALNILNVYHYLNRKHQHLVDGVDREIKKLIANNEIEEITGIAYNVK